MPLRLLALTVCVLLGAGRGDADPLVVAAASDLHAVMPALVRTFQAETGDTVRVTYGSSGNFHAQIRRGAPFDVFLSADVEYPRALVREGRADAASLHTYALGRLVLWARHEAAVDVTQGLAGLARAEVLRIAVANPAHAPYGRAAMAAIEASGLSAALGPKLVFGENASQAAQFVQSGNAQAGLLPLALALAPPLSTGGRHVIIPTSLHPPIVQAAVIVSGSRHKAAAGRFLAFLRREDTALALARAGFLRP